MGSNVRNSYSPPFEILLRDPGPEVEAVQAEMLAAAHQISEAKQKLVACIGRLPMPPQRMHSGEVSPTVAYALQEAINHTCLHYLSPAVASLLDAVRTTPESLEAEYRKWKEVEPDESRLSFRIGGVGGDR